MNSSDITELINTLWANTDMGMKETRSLEVKVNIDRILLGWLSAVTKEHPKVVMCHLYDMTTKPLERLLKRNGHHCYDKVIFPGTEIVLKVGAARFHDRESFWKDRREWHEKESEVIAKALLSSDITKWRNANRSPEYSDDKYNYVKCTFTLPKDNKEITMTRDEMDTLMTETFLLGDPE